MSSSSVELRCDPRASLDAQRSLACPIDPTTAKPGAFHVHATVEGGHARAARLWTAHGPVETPCFMPVGTYGAVKGILPEELDAVGSQIILANAYHLGHRPGAAEVERWGGVHGMMGWSGPILTDSGGFQVFSLRGLQKIDDEGVDYRTHYDGTKSRMTPRSVLEVERALGSDICMILDHCPPGDADSKLMRAAVDRSTKWAREAAALRPEILRPEQLCFGIVQGGTDLAIRREHLATLADLPFDGLALGGLSVGEPPPLMHATIAEVAPEMPDDRPRYVMGIGTPLDLLVAVRAGIDMFDCVMPTRHARNGQLFTFEGRISIRRAQHRTELKPVSEGCGCLTCQRFTRAYLRHLHAQNDPLYVRLATLHNLYFFHEWVGRLRQAVHDGNFPEVAASMMALVEERRL